MKSVAIVVGHTAERPGALAADGVGEWHWQRPLANQIAVQLADLDIDGTAYYRGPLPYGLAMHDVVQRVNRADPDLVLSLHFNSAPESHKGQMHGTMALYWPTSRTGKLAARALSSACAAAQGTRDRGPRSQAVSWAGSPLYILRDTRAPAVILETHYGDNAQDHQRASVARDNGSTAAAIAGAIGELLCE